MSYINTWGIYQAFEGIDDDMIDIDDRMNFFTIIPNGKIFRCVNEGENLTLRYRDKEYRVNPKLYKVVNEPKYKIGDKVNIISKSKIVEITDIYWHIKKNASFYFVQEDGKKSTRRYYESELEILNEF